MLYHAAHSRAVDALENINKLQTENKVILSFTHKAKIDFMAPPGDTLNHHADFENKINNIFSQAGKDAMKLLVESHKQTVSSLQEKLLACQTYMTQDIESKSQHIIFPTKKMRAAFISHFRTSLRIALNTATSQRLLDKIERQNQKTLREKQIMEAKEKVIQNPRPNIEMVVHKIVKKTILTQPKPLSKSSHSAHKESKKTHSAHKESKKTHSHVVSESKNSKGPGKSQGKKNVNSRKRENKQKQKPNSQKKKKKSQKNQTKQQKKEK